MPPLPLSDLIGNAALLAPIVWALVHALKQAGMPRDTFTAIIAIFIGPLLAILWTVGSLDAYTWRDLVPAGFTGLLASLAAMGAYKLQSWTPPDEQPPANPPANA